MNAWTVLALLIGATAVVAALAMLLWVLQNLARIERKVGRPLRPVYRMLDAFSARFPDLFWERNLRVGWMKGVAWHGSNDPVVGYVDRHSATPGEALRLFMSAALDLKVVRGHVEVHRFTNLTPGTDPILWQSDTVQVPFQPLNLSAPAVGTNWEPTVEIPIGEDWKPGFYLAEFVRADGTRTVDMAFFIVTNPAFSGDLVLKIGTATYQAYNTWGGYSLYNSHYAGRQRKDPGRGQLLTFNRPTSITRFRWYDQYYIAWIESFCAREGLKLDYASSLDVHCDERFTTEYDLFIATGHDEYWSGVEFDRVYRRIFEAGRNTMFLGGNMAFWEVRYLDLYQPPGQPPYPRHMLCHKQLSDPIRWRTSADGSDMRYVTARFRDDARRPETMLMGVGHGDGYDGAWGFKYNYQVKSVDFPFFRDTGFTEGDVIADLIGHEWDSRDPRFRKVEYPRDRLWNAERSDIPLLPADRIRLVLSGGAKDKSGTQTEAEAVYFESPAGAKVFSAGTIAWGRPLSNPASLDERFQILNANLILDFLSRR